MMPAHPLVTAEWPPLTEVPEYDWAIQEDEVHLGVYVRRVAGEGWFTLAGLVNHVVVLPAERGKGLGSNSVRTAIAWLLSVRVPFAVIHCDPSVSGFYWNHGFRPAANFPAPTHNGPRLSMVAEISGQPWWRGPIEYVEPW